MYPLHRRAAELVQLLRCGPLLGDDRQVFIGQALQLRITCGLDGGKQFIVIQLLRKPVKQALVALGPFDGLQQSIRFDRYGDTSRKGVFVLMREGRFVLEQ